MLRIAQFTVTMILLAFALSACSLVSEQCDVMTTDNLAEQNPDGFRVFKNTDGRELNSLKESSDRSEIAALLQVIKNADGKWRIDAAGVPVGQFRVVFYKTGERINSISFGKEIIIAQGCGYFAAASIPTSDQAKLLKVTGIMPEDLQ